MKVIIITGASSGIGKATTILFADSNYQVIAMGRNEEVLNEIRKCYPKNVQTICADFTDITDDIISKISKCLESIDNANLRYIVNCAATAEPFLPLTSVSRSDLRKIFELNVIFPINLLQCVSKYLSKWLTPNFGSRFLFIGSSYDTSNPSLSDAFHPGLTGSYAISKTALRTAVEYLKFEIKSCQTMPAIGYYNPGATSTPMYDKFISKMEAEKILANWTPTQPEKIAELIKFKLESTNIEEFSNFDNN